MTLIYIVWAVAYFPVAAFLGPTIRNKLAGSHFLCICTNPNKKTHHPEPRRLYLNAMATIVLISCVKKKLIGAKNVTAKDLYISPLFKKAWAYANQLNADKIFILSAKHGLLNPESKIDDYDISLVKAKVSERKDWTVKVIEQMEQEGISLQDDKFVILAGKNYYDFLQEKLNPDNCTFPYANKGRIGHILRFLTQELSK